MIKEERRRKKRRKIGLYILLILILLIAAGVFIVMNVFTVENVVVEGNELYSSTQIENMVLNDEYSWNSLYVIQICGYRGSSVCRYDGGFTGQSPYRTY